MIQIYSRTANKRLLLRLLLRNQYGILHACTPLATRVTLSHNHRLTTIHILLHLHYLLLIPIIYLLNLPLYLSLLNLPLPLHPTVPLPYLRDLVLSDRQQIIQPPLLPLHPLSLLPVLRLLLHHLRLHLLRLPCHVLDVYPQLILESYVLADVLLQLLNQLLIHRRHLLLLLIRESRGARVARGLGEVLASGGELGFTDNLLFVVAAEQLIFLLVIFILAILIRCLAQTLLDYYSVCR